MPNITNFRTYVVSGIASRHLNESQAQAFGAAVISVSRRDRWWSDERDLRFSLLKCDRLFDTYVAGVLTQQHRLERHLYDDAKRESVAEIDSYADRFFVLDVGRGMLLLEWRRFTKQPPLTPDVTVERLALILSDVLREVGLPGEAQLVPFERHTAKEEFLSLFYENRVLEVIVDEIGKEYVPADVILVNPNPHLEGALREILEHDLREPSLGSITAQVRDDSEASLSRSAIVRGAMHSGTPKILRYQHPNGHIHIRKETERGIVTVNVPTDTTDTPEDRAYIAASVLHELGALDIDPMSVLPKSLPPQSDTDNLNLFE